MRILKLRKKDLTPEELEDISHTFKTKAGVIYLSNRSYNIQCRLCDDLRTFPDIEHAEAFIAQDMEDCPMDAEANGDVLNMGHAWKAITELQAHEIRFGPATKGN